METCKITNGPFKGLEAPAGELRAMMGRDNQPLRYDDGEVVMYWDIAARSRHFLDKFPVTDGWAVRIKAERSDISMSDPETMVTDEQGRLVQAIQPTVIFTAALISPTGNVLATASAMAVINNAGAWQKGESKARGRLYSAIGLDLFGSVDEEHHEPTQAATAQPPTGKGLDQVKPLDLDDDEHQPKDAAEPNQSKAAKPSKPRKAKSAKAQSKDESAQEAEDQQAQGGDEPGKAKEGEPVALNQNLLRQVQHRAKLAGKDVPEFASNTELQAFNNALLKAQQGSVKANGASGGAA